MENFMWEELLRKLKEKEQEKDAPLYKELELPLYNEMPKYEEPDSKDDSGERGVVVIEL